MAPFTFRLETLWKLRVADRQQRREELAEALEAETLLQTRKEEMGSELKELRKRRAVVSQAGEIDVDALTQSHRYELITQAQIQLLDQQAAQLAVETQRRRQALVEAEREVKTLEKLREKQYAEYVFEEQKREQKELDEIAGRRVPRG